MRNILVRGLERYRGLDGMSDLDRIRKLRKGEPYRLWKRGSRPTQIRPGDRVFLVSEEKVVGSCKFEKVDENDHGPDKNGNPHNGPAIVVLGPFSPQNPPVPVPSNLLGRGWGWKYVPEELEPKLR